MKRLFLLLIIIVAWRNAGAQEFKYAFVSDTHIGATTAEEDLRRTVADINAQEGLAFVIITGDITEMGTRAELKTAHQILSELKLPYYVVPGNHDTGWSESGGVDFITEFGYDKFTFDYKGYRFIGCASGPYVRMSDGHIPRDAAIWLKQLLANTPADMPVIFTNHYPLDNALDNWYETLDLLKARNTGYIICGHGHQNKALNFEGIPATMGRSNLRAKDSIGGYNIVTMKDNTVYFAVKYPGQPAEAPWHVLTSGARQMVKAAIERPSFAINQQYPNVKQKWIYHANANVVLTPATAGKMVFFGNSSGELEALGLDDGNRRWVFKTGGAIYSSPATAGKLVVFGSGDGNIYALEALTGKLVWEVNTDAAVLGSPVIENNVVYIGGSDHQFRAINLRSGKQIWSFADVAGAVAGTPLLYRDKVIFGCWNKFLYALDRSTGALSWKWSNGSENRMLSPAMCTPVASEGVVYIAAPDRVLSAIDFENGQTLWRNKDATVRESIGISKDGRWIYGKTMNDEVVAYATGRTDTGIKWRLNMGFGYEHVPSMLIEKGGLVHFGTKNGVVYAFNPQQQVTAWAHKIDNAMVNTVNVLDVHNILVSTMDGIVTLINTR